MKSSSNILHFLSVYWHNNTLGVLGEQEQIFKLQAGAEWFTNDSRAFPTSQVYYYTGDHIEISVYYHY